MYQVGYGIAAFGVGPLVDNGVGLSTIFGWTAVAAAALAALSFVVARGQASPDTCTPARLLREKREWLPQKRT